MVNMKKHLPVILACCFVLFAAEVFAEDFCSECLSFKVGPAGRVIGPDGQMNGVSDNLFNVINVNGIYRGYTANVRTMLMEGPSIEGLGVDLPPISWTQS